MKTFTKPTPVIIKPADDKHCSKGGVQCPFCVYTIQEDDKWFCPAYDVELVGKLKGFEETVYRFDRCIIEDPNIKVPFNRLQHQ